MQSPERSGVRFQQILGVRFLVGTAEEAIAEISRSGGLVVVPSAPTLKDMAREGEYREALLGADFAIADSTLMVVLWNLLERDRIPKLSGLKYLRALLEQPEMRVAGRSFWVMPNAEAAERNGAWLRAHGVCAGEDDMYVAPIYGARMEDEELAARLETRRPQHVVLGVGGGVQERLGFYLKRKLSYRPAIHCIGAAIGFLTGDQVKIPVWVDQLGLGWLWRVVWNPKRFGRRYWEARRLAPLMVRFRERMPEGGEGAGKV